MAKVSFLLGQITALALMLWTIAEAIDITDIFTVQTGTNNGGCDARLTVLDDWLSEIIQSLDTALVAILDYNNDERVRKSMSVIFGIADEGKSLQLKLDDDKDKHPIKLIYGKCQVPPNFAILFLYVVINISVSSLLPA